MANRQNDRSMQNEKSVNQTADQKQQGRSEQWQDRSSQEQRPSRSSDIQDDNIGGREAGGPAGTGGVSTTDVGRNQSSKQTRLER